MRKLRLAGVAGLTIAAFAVPTTTASADDFIYSCPDHYQPVPTQALPPGGGNKDSNNNQIVCAKGPQGSNGHFNVKDDRGNVVPPTQWNVQAVAPYGQFLVTYALDAWTTYALDQTPTDVVDDITP